FRVGVNESRAYFRLFRGHGQVGDQGRKTLPFFGEAGERDDEASHQVGAVVEGIVLFQSGMTARFDGEGRVLSLSAQSFGFVDDVLISPFETVMYAAVRRNELRETVRSYRIGHDVCARFFFQQYGGNEGDQA